MTNTKNPITECDGCPNEAVVLDGENDGFLIGGDCTECGYYVTRYVSEFDADEARNATIYDYLDNGGSVHDDIRDMSMEDMEDYFGDMDPAEFL